MLDNAHYTVFFINFYANKNVLSGITTTYMLQLMILIQQLIIPYYKQLY